MTEPRSRRSGFDTIRWVRDHVYVNHLFGRPSEEITSAEQCSIVRGSRTNSGVLTEQNRGYNVHLTQTDANILANDSANVDGRNGGVCFSAGVPQTATYWGGNSPINLDPIGSSSGVLTLRSSTPQ